MDNLKTTPQLEEKGNKEGEEGVGEVERQGDRAREKILLSVEIR